MLKNTLLITIVLFAFACGNPSNEEGSSEVTNTEETVEEAQPSILGEWTLGSVVGTESSEAVELNACDSSTKWNFTEEDAGTLGDGTAVKKIIAKAPESCKFYGFDSKWTMTEDGKLFISSTKVGGIGGPSNAGLFDVEELTNDKLVLKILRNRYTFSR
jgi:hypothetical protein